MNQTLSIDLLADVCAMRASEHYETMVVLLRKERVATMEEFTRATDFARFCQLQGQVEAIDTVLSVLFNCEERLKKVRNS